MPLIMWRCSGITVHKLDSGSRDPVKRPRRVIMLCSWAEHLTVTVPLYTLEYKWVQANCNGKLEKCQGVICDG